jgi:DNA polymerase-1
MKKLLVIDGNSILNRAFYGIRPLTNREGLHTNALFGTLNILLKHMGELKPDYAVIAYDLPAPTFRHKEYEHYKEGRKKMPDELAVQLPYSKRLAEALGIKVMTLEGYEADDILGTVARIARDGDVHSYVLTGDRDALQLIDEKTTVLLSTNADTLVFDRDAFFEKYGVEPSEFVDVKALMGDSSDNIPGVPGIGEKTALKLIAEFKSIDGVYENLENAGLGKSAKQKMQDGQELAYLSKKLAAIKTDTPLGVTLDDLKSNGTDRGELYALLQELEFTSHIKRL